MPRGFHHRARPTDFTLGFLELNGIDELATLVTLVTPGLLVATEGTHALHKAVSQEAGTVFTPQLLHSILQHKTSSEQPLEDILGNFGLLRSGSPTKNIK